MYLYKPSEGIQSDPVDFYYYPTNPDAAGSKWTFKKKNTYVSMKLVFSENFVDEGVGLNTSKKPRKSFDTGDLMALDKQPQQPRIK